jgi:uroporphyrinogen-III decarboxylase
MAYPGVLKDFKDCIDLRSPRRVPVFALELGIGWKNSGMTYEEERTNVGKAVQSIVGAVRRFDVDWAMIFPDDYIEFEPLGLKMRHPVDGPAMAAEYFPLTRETLRRFRFPDPHKDMRLPIHLEMIRRVKKTLGDTVCVVGRIAAPFTAPALLYGIDTWLMGMLEEPDLFRDNISYFIDYQIAFGKAQIEAGADTLWLGDCVADSNFVRPEHFAKFAFEPAAKVITELNKAGGQIIYHSGETSLPHVKWQAQLPRCAVNLGEGPSIAEIRRALGARKCFTGNFDPKFLRDAAPDAVAAATEKMIRENLPDGGYVFCTGEGVMATTPVQNVDAMMRAAQATVAEMMAPKGRKKST